MDRVLQISWHVQRSRNDRTAGNYLILFLGLGIDHKDWDCAMYTAHEDVRAAKKIFSAPSTKFHIEKLLRL